MITPNRYLHKETGVLLGNSTRDTVCEKCQIGKTYSDVTSPTEPCKRVRMCGAAEVAQPSLGQSDNECVVPETVNHGNGTSVDGP